MASKIDSAILEALGLDSSVTKITSHGGSGFASTFKISSTVEGVERNYFVKTGSGANYELMFNGTTDASHDMTLKLTQTRRARVAQRYPRCCAKLLPKVLCEWCHDGV